ncbi:MAG: helix-turn-helix domain-containing protein [Thermoanaerobaculia bacterium]
MRTARLLTPREAAGMAGVVPSTIKRWAENGLLPYMRTAGGHRRFERLAVERFLDEQARPEAHDRSRGESWIRCLVEGRRHEIDGRLLEARGRLASWCHVADEVAAALVAMGAQWESGRLTIAEEHVASDALARALARMGDALPVRVDGPRSLLACAGEDEHTLGLSLAELCLRERGWAALWLGRRTPLSELVRLIRSGEVAMIGLSASLLLGDRQTLRPIADEVGAVCEERGVGLVLGGAGAWPDRPSFGVRVTSFTAFGDYLTLEEGRP